MVISAGLPQPHCPSSIWPSYFNHVYPAPQHILKAQTSPFFLSGESLFSTHLNQNSMHVLTEGLQKESAYPDCQILGTWAVFALEGGGTWAGSG